MIIALQMLAVVLWASGFLCLWRISRCPAQGAEDAEDVSVIIPARNEEKTLPRLLASLRRQDIRPREILVVDDHSTDATARVAADGGARVIASADLPDGWLGKSWACWQGAGAAAGSTFLFLDADTILEPGGLSRIVGAYRLLGGLVSLWPFHCMARPYEWLSAYFIIVIMAGMRAFSVLGRRRAPLGACGPCIVCSRSDYLATGGHERVRGSVLEDVELGRAFLAAGVPVRCLGGRGAISFRMYPDGPGGLVAGFTKNMATGAAAAASTPLLVLVAAWIAGACMVTFWTLSTAITVIGAAAVAAPGAGPIPWLILYGLYVLQTARMLARVGSYPFPVALLFPMPLAFFAVVFFQSVFRTLILRKVSWKGRSIRLPKRSA